MWLQPILSPLARTLTRVYHRLEVAGGLIPQAGPALLVANHPNSLIDPAVVTGVAQRPVRFLAKHTLFRGSATSWVVRAAGSIPIYRREDGADLLHQNQDAFEAVFQALEGGSAVGIFPEGRSHSESSLAPLKSGAARIALGAAERLGATFPIIPIGLTFEHRDTFRSRGIVVVGDPVEWGDIGATGAISIESIRALTNRIDLSLRRVTVNLERWDDGPIVHTAEEIMALEMRSDPQPHAKILRLKEITDGLRELRARGGEDNERLIRDLTRHDRLLRRLRLRPPEVLSWPAPDAMARWTGKTAPLFGLVGLALLAVGSAVFWPPYRLVAFAVSRARPLHDVRSTYKLAAGAVLYTCWWALLTGLVFWFQGWVAATVVAISLPILGLLTLTIQEHWSAVFDDARTFWMHRTRPRTVAAIAARQRDLARRLQVLYDRPVPSRSSPLSDQSQL